MKALVASMATTGRDLRASAETQQQRELHAQEAFDLLARLHQRVKAQVEELEASRVTVVRAVERGINYSICQ